MFTTTLAGFVDRSNIKKSNTRSIIMEQLAEIARQKKEAFLKLRGNKAPYEELDAAAKEYADAIAAWHKVRFPGKKFTKPSTAYLIRAL
jgi:hypothetical protein